MTSIQLPRPSELSTAQRQEATRLYSRALELQRDGTPENTRRAYEGDWRRFRDWCERLGQRALPASPQTIILYVTHLADPTRAADIHSRAGMCKPATIDRAVSAISYFHRLNGFVSPRESIHVRNHVRKTKVALKINVQQAAPLLVPHLRAIVARMPATDPVAIRDKAVLLLGWAAALRRSELAALDRRDVAILEHGALLTIASSKTDQEGAGEAVPIEPAMHTELCPLLALRAWLEIHTDGDPLFVRTWRGELDAERIVEREVNAIVQKWTRRSQVSPENPSLRFSAHSLRAGFITEAARAGHPEWRIMQHSRHDSYESFRGYIRIANPFQDNPGKGLL